MTRPDTSFSQDPSFRSRSSEVPAPVRGAVLAEVSKQEQRKRRREKEGQPLWEQPRESSPEFWMAVDQVRGREDEVAHVGDDGVMLFAHEGEADDLRVRCVRAEEIPAEAQAIREIEHLDSRFEELVTRALATAGEEVDFTREELLGMKEALIVEASVADEPESVLFSLVRSLTRADQRERKSDLVETYRELREAEQALETADPKDAKPLRAKIQALHRQVYVLRREVNPKATREELQQLADDAGEYLEPVNWRPHKEPGVEEIRLRLEELEEQLSQINQKGTFQTLDELKWYSLRRERDEYAFMLRAAEFREEHPTLFETDFVKGKEGMPWDRRLFAVGKELIQSPRVSRDTVIYRMLRDVYVDPASQDKTVHIIDSILRSRTSPESLKGAARAVKEDVREGLLPRPEALIERRRAVQKQEQEKRLDSAQAAQRKREEARRSPLEIAFEFVPDAQERIEGIQQELGLSSERDLMALRETIKTLERFTKQVGGRLEVTWPDFVKAPLAEVKERKTGFFGRLFGKLFGIGEAKPRRAKAGFFAPRRRMIRQLKRAFRGLPGHTQRSVRSALEYKGANVLEL